MHGVNKLRDLVDDAVDQAWMHGTALCIDDFVTFWCIKSAVDFSFLIFGKAYDDFIAVLQ